MEFPRCEDYDSYESDFSDSSEMLFTPEEINRLKVGDSGNSNEKSGNNSDCPRYFSPRFPPINPCTSKKYIPNYSLPPKSFPKPYANFASFQKLKNMDFYEIVKLQEELDHIKARYTNEFAVTQLLKTENRSKTEEIKKFKKVVEELKNTESRLTQKNNALDKEFEDTKARFFGFKNAYHATTQNNDYLKEKVMMLQFAKMKLAKKYTDLKKEFEDLQSKTAEILNAAKPSSTILEENRQVKTDPKTPDDIKMPPKKANHQDWEKLCHTMAEDLCAKTRASADLRQENCKLKTEISDLLKKNEDLKAKLNQTTADMRFSEYTNAALKAEIKDLKKSIMSIENALIRALTRETQLTKDLNLAQAKNQKLQEDRSQERNHEADFLKICRNKIISLKDKYEQEIQEFKNQHQKEMEAMKDLKFVEAMITKNSENSIF